jgi:hypothetical protein
MAPNTVSIFLETFLLLDAVPRRCLARRGTDLWHLAEPVECTNLLGVTSSTLDLFLALAASLLFFFYCSYIYLRSSNHVPSLLTRTARRRPPQPFHRVGEAKAQVETLGAISQLLFHGCQVPWYVDLGISRLKAAGLLTSLDFVHAQAASALPPFSRTRKPLLSARDAALFSANRPEARRG